MDNLTRIIAIICTIGLPVGLGMYLAIRSSNQKHKEKMEMIKQGIAPSESTKSVPNKYRTLRSGMLVLGIALGLGGGLLVGRNLGMTQDNMFWAVAPGILLGLGIAYVAFFIIVKDKNFDKEAE